MGGKRENERVQLEGFVMLTNTRLVDLGRRDRLLPAKGLARRGAARGGKGSTRTRACLPVELHARAGYYCSQRAGFAWTLGVHRIGQG